MKPTPGSPAYASLGGHGRRRAAKNLANLIGGTVVGARTADPVVSVTFDDGPDPVVTPALLEVLARHEAHATFFLLGQRAVQYPEIVERILEEGHEVALHGDTHLRLSQATLRQVWSGIRDGRAHLHAVSGTRPKIFRPPYGSMNLRVAAVASAHRLRIVGWTATAEDWLDEPAETVAERGLSRLDTGGVLLLHDRYEPRFSGDPHAVPSFDRADLLDQLLSGIRQRGWRSVTTTELLQRRRPRKVILLWRW